MSSPVTRGITPPSFVVPTRVTLEPRLTSVQVPLRTPDADVPLDLQAALSAIYDESDYGEQQITQLPHQPRRCQSKTRPGWLCS